MPFKMSIRLAHQPQGPTLRVWYGVLDRRIGSVGRFASLRKVAVDQLAFNPCFTVVFLTANGLTQGLQLQKVRHNIQRDYVDIMLAAWSVRLLVLLLCGCLVAF